MPQNMHVDITGWQEKYKEIFHLLGPAIKKACDEGQDILLKQTIENVTGDAYGSHKSKKGNVVWHRGTMTNAGKLPVPIRTNALRKSIKWAKIHDHLRAIYSDANVAPYNQYVHDGTKYMKPRRYLGEAVQGKTQSINDRFAVAIKNVLRKAEKVGG